jgi:hypothetical protein
MGKIYIVYTYVLKSFKVLLLIGVKMSLKSWLAIILFAALILSLSEFVQAPRPFRGFVITLPEMVEAEPGQTITINGSVLNIGQWWLHDFNISLKGLPEGCEVKVIPERFEHLKIIREWNPEQGLYRVPEKFLIEIKIPENATGAFLINVTGKEWTSWKKVENPTMFILKISSPPKLSISDIVVPEEVKENEPFNISFEVKNEGLVDQQVSLKVVAPEDWKVEPVEQNLSVKANSSELLIFTLTPTNTSGEISVFLQYPYKTQILNLTKAGPYIIPSVAEMPKVEIPTALASLVSFFKSNPIIAIITIILLLIIFWNVYQIVKGMRIKKIRKKPEEIIDTNYNLTPI